MKEERKNGLKRRRRKQRCRYRSRKAEMMAQEKRSEDGMKTIRKGDQKEGERVGKERRWSY